MRIFLHSNFDTNSGYGNTATNLAIELEKLGIDVYPICKSIGFEMPYEFTKLFNKKTPQNLFFDFYINFDTPFNLYVPDNFNFCKFKIAYTMWEQTRLTKNFKNKYINKFDYLVVPCSMNIEPFEKVFNKQILINPLGVDTIFYSPISREFNTEYLNVCCNGAMTYRKGVDKIIDVMLDDRIKELNIIFNIKNSQRTIHPDIVNKNPKINLYEGIWPKETIRQFYYDNHIMLAVSRGEGFNQPALEFLSTGGVVLTHNWGGHSVWASQEYCEIIPYKMTKVKNWDYADENSECAEVETEDIIKSLILLYNNRGRLKQLSMNAIKMADYFGFDIMTRNFKILLERIKDENNRNSMS